MESVIQFMLVCVIAVLMFGLVIIQAIKRKRKRLKTEVENEDFIVGVVTNKRVMENERYYIELDNEYMYKATSLKDYNALPLNTSCKIIVWEDDIKYIEGFTTFNSVEDKDYDKIEWVLMILLVIVGVASIYTAFFAF